MNTTIKQQQDAIGEAMKARSFTLRNLKGHGLSPEEHQADPQWAALNDAASTLAAIRFEKQAKKDYQKENKELRDARDAYSDRLSKGRHYLMGVQKSDLNVEDALEAFGYDSNGFD